MGLPQDQKLRLADNHEMLSAQMDLTTAETETGGALADFCSMHKYRIFTRI